MKSISLAATRQLHGQLIARWKTDPRALAAGCAAAERIIRQRGIKFERDRSLPVALSALVLDAAAVGEFNRVARTLHEVVERALDWVLASAERLQRYFADHRRMFPYLCKTPGLATWQGFARYDAVITPEGRIKIIELNTGCPAGFLHAENFSHVTREAIRSLALELDYCPEGFGTIRPNVLIDELLAIEEAAGIRPGLIALVNDENNLLNELDLIGEAFRARGRDVQIVHAADLRYHDGRAYRGDVPVSLTLNKIRISTANSPGWNWKAGFEDRYAGFLAAMNNGAMASVNNLAGLTIGEDKGLLQVLQQPEFQANLDPAQQEFIAEHVLWTARLEEGRVRPPIRWDEALPHRCDAETIDLLPYVRRHREQLVIKPANEGRGFRVVIGKYCSEEAWQEACRPDENLPCIVQEYVPAATLPVIDPRAQQPAVVEMSLTVGLAVIRGRYHGLLARVSANPVNNVGLEGIIQAVLTTETEPT